MLTKFLSTKLLVVLGTIGVAVAPMFIEKVTEAIDWRIFALAGGYIVVNAVQNVLIAWINRPEADKAP